MKNFLQTGDIVAVPAPYLVASSGGVQVGSLFGIAEIDAANGAEVVIKTTGVFRMPKLSAQAWTVGQLVYWDDTNKWATTVASTNLLIGKALAIAANPSTTGTVRLNG